ncbi:MAG: hypothetical protein HFG79_08490 [Lachnospiraceae bacterium]|jgi:hypothetical protein|nr:hypothetical protein [Lachnospiraceae bacterium]
MFLYHYYDASMKPFQNLSDASIEEAKKILKDIALKKPGTQCAKRADEYMELRHYYEEILRCEFMKKGGNIRRKSPHYMVVEHSPWLASWFENSAFIKIDLDEFDKSTLSFTYGDSHPTFSKRVNDGKEYRKKLYTYDEILAIIAKYGYPQDWNNDGKYGPERYVEAHIWSDDVIKRYM